jgi:aspartate-semialdehyde dehydrogenase
MPAASGRELKIAIVGATGAVGEQIVELIDARALPCAELALFASERGAAQTVEALGEALIVSEFREVAELSRFDIVYLAVSRSWAADIVRAHPGPLLVDLSAALKPPAELPDVAFLAPGFSAPGRIAEAAGKEKLVAIPHPSAHALATIISAAGPGIGTVCATVLLGASSAGRQSVEEMVRETTELLSGTHDVEESETQRAFNVYPDEDEPGLAAALAAQTGALLGGGPPLLIEVVHVPVLHGSAMTVMIPGLPQPETLSERLRAAPGLLLSKGDEDKAGTIDAIGQEAIIAAPIVHAGGVVIWCAFDSARLAALDAVWIAEKLAAIWTAGSA